MPKCKYCGTFAGLFVKEHLYCAQAAATGKSVQDIEALHAAARIPAPRPLTLGSIVGGIFWGLWLWTISAAFVVLIFKAIVGQL